MPSDVRSTVSVTRAPTFAVTASVAPSLAPITDCVRLFALSAASMASGRVVMAGGTVTLGLELARWVAVASAAESRRMVSMFAALVDLTAEILLGLMPSILLRSRAASDHASRTCS